MTDYYIDDPLATITYQEKKCVVCPIADKGGDLSFWYCVIDWDSYQFFLKCNDVQVHEQYESKFLCNAIDIRTLPNYVELSPSQILFHRNSSILPLIKNALQSKLIAPIQLLQVTLDNIPLLIRDRKNMKLGSYILLVRQIRGQIDSMSYKQMADIFKTTAAVAENIVFIIKNHPDWDDKVVASELVEE